MTQIQTATEKEYPISMLWVFKTPIMIIIVSIIALLFGYWFPYLVLLFIILLIANPLIRANFHYSTEDKFFLVKQGVLSKKQRNLPYGVIQNVFVKQDIFDRIFGLASLRVENAAQGSQGGVAGRRAASAALFGGGLVGRAAASDTLGSSGNKVNIPGLKKKDAEALKAILLQRMKDNPLEDSQSGL